ncbi:hypothetical protein GGQ60_001640 [Pedobacter zeae]|uniref:Uncharacterized protein n=1 Tax=Pedobacter zeae TaxID=1737356 RepID=A0A7W6P4J6_9SPHI|nr:hypothetical protein [Pedobacter zeae]
MELSPLKASCSLLVDVSGESGSRCVAFLFLVEDTTAHNFDLFNSPKNLST